LQGSTRPVDIQIAPDGLQLLLIAAGDSMDELVKLVTELDRTEPVETRTYRPHYFNIDEVGNLLQQLFKSSASGAAQIEIVRDKLTHSLLIQATAEQHRRVSELLASLDNAPPTARRQVRTFAVKHRSADELAKVLTGLIATGVAQAGPAEPVDPATGGQPGPPVPTHVNPGVPDQRVAVQAAADNPVILSSDTITNTLIALGEPRALDQVAALLTQLDQRQPQVDIEVLMVSLSDAQNQSLGVELLKRITDGETSATVSSLFGLSKSSGTDPLARGLVDGANGLGGVILRPGDFAGVVKALETVTDGRQFVRSKVVVNNNAKAIIDGVLEESLVSSNSNGVSGTTTSVNGTSDAGTKIKITPQISSGDYVNVNYDISQSSFLGESTTTDSGTRIPPTRRKDSVASVATIPDGSDIALGGLSNRGDSKKAERVPLLGSIPFFGALFRNTSKTQTDSRFYVFIRVNIMRQNDFSDLRRMSDTTAKNAQLDPLEPTLEPVLIR
jgi:general secretion pathway protein D